MKALVLIDIQIGLTKRKGLFQKALFFDVINNAITLYRESNDMIIFFQHNNKQLVMDTEDWEIDNRINIKDDDIILQKQYGNVFENEELNTVLKNNNINEVLICGLVSHGCIKRSCIKAISKGYNISLLENGHTNWNKDAQQKIISTESKLKELGVKMFHRASFVKKDQKINNDSKMM